MLTENQITDALADFLESNQYTILKKLTSKQRGIDLVALSPTGVRHHIEVKGETSGRENSARFGKPFQGKQIWTHVSVALLKTLTTIKEIGEQGNKFGMAFPGNHRQLLTDIKPSLDRLGIDVYLVNEEHIVIL